MTRHPRMGAGSVTTDYVYSADGQLMAEYGGTPTSVGTQYLVADHLGSTRLILDAQGNCAERIDYAPFGAQLSRSGQPCYTSSTSGLPLFTGQIRDGESAAGTDTGLDYFNARYFWATLGRLTSPDEPLVDQNVLDPQSWNLYSYVRNNPLSYIDPTGRSCVDSSGQVVKDTEGSGAVGDNGDGKGCGQVGVKVGSTNENPDMQPQEVDVDEKIDPLWEARMAYVMRTTRQEDVRPEWLNAVTSVFGYDQDVPLPSCFGGFLSASLGYANPYIPGPSSAGEVLGAAGSAFWYNRALSYAASTPSRSFGTPHLVYPNKSSVFRSLLKRSGRAIPAGALIGVDVALFQALARFHTFYSAYPQYR